VLWLSSGPRFAEVGGLVGLGVGERGWRLAVEAGLVGVKFVG
jgi:hypothetical protein